MEANQAVEAQLDNKSSEQNSVEAEKGKALNSNTTSRRERGGVCAYKSGCSGTLLYTAKWPQKLEELPEGTTLIIKDWHCKELTQKEDNSPFTTNNLINISEEYLAQDKHIQ